MMRDIANFATGSFIDYLGNERKFTICALSMSPDPSEDATYNVAWVDEDNQAWECQEIKRCLQIGASLCMAEDEYSDAEGERIAEDKARQDHTSIAQIHVTKNGIINQDFVDMILNNQLEYVSKNPEKVFINYRLAKEKYELEKQLKDTLTAEEWTVYLLTRDKKVKKNFLKKISEK